MDNFFFAYKMLDYNDIIERAKKIYRYTCENNKINLRCRECDVLVTKMEHNGNICKCGSFSKEEINFIKEKLK